jgi:hypothetical protein
MGNQTNIEASAGPATLDETPTAFPGLVTKKTVAKAAAVSTRCVEGWMQRRLIPFVRISPRCVRFHLPSVLAALRRLEIKSV